MSDHKKPLKAKVPPSPQSVHRVNDRNVNAPIDCAKNVKEGVKGDIRKTPRGWGPPPRDIARIADEVADEEEALSRSETDDSGSTHELGQPRHQSTDESSVDNDDRGDHDKSRKDALRYQDRSGEAPTHGKTDQDDLATIVEIDSNHHVTQKGPNCKSTQQKQKEAATFQELAETQLLQTSLPRWLFTPNPAIKREPTNIKLPFILEKQVNHAKADAELAVYLSYKHTLQSNLRFLEEYKKIQDSSFGEG